MFKFPSNPPWSLLSPANLTISWLPTTTISNEAIKITDNGIAAIKPIKAVTSVRQSTRYYNYTIQNNKNNTQFSPKQRNLLLPYQRLFLVYDVRMGKSIITKMPSIIYEYNHRSIIHNHPFTFCIAFRFRTNI